MATVNWPEVIAGFAIGLTPLAIRQITILARYFRASGRRKYLGMWWTYHRSSMGSGEVIESEMSINYSIFFDRLSVQYIRRNAAGPGSGARLNYIGSLTGRQGMARYVSLKDPASHEQVTWYIFDPFMNPISRTNGIYLALDLNGIPVAGPIFFSRERTPIAEAAAQLSGQVIRLHPLRS